MQTPYRGHFLEHIYANNASGWFSTMKLELQFNPALLFLSNSKSKDNCCQALTAPQPHLSSVGGVGDGLITMLSVICHFARHSRIWVATFEYIQYLSTGVAGCR